MREAVIANAIQWDVQYGAIRWGGVPQGQQQQSPQPPSVGARPDVRSTAIGN